MSREGLDNFFEFLTENREHQASVKMKSFGGNADALAAYARELGYDISPEELRQLKDIALRKLKSVMQNKLWLLEASLSPGAREFYALIKMGEADESVAERLAELAAETPEDLIAYGMEEGFIFDEQDMWAVGKDIGSVRQGVEHHDGGSFYQKD